MKKLFLIVLCAGFLSSCFFMIDNKEPDDSDEPHDTGERTLVVFDNTRGKTTVSVFNDYRRSDSDKITDVPAKQLIGEIEYASGAFVPFYFSYLIKLKGIYNFSFPFTPPEIGKDQIMIPIYENKENKIIIPRLEETITSQDQLLSRDAYLLIQNNSTFPFKLQLGSSIIQPDNSPDSTVLAGEKAIYKIMPGIISNYQLHVGADYKPVLPPDGGYKAGRIYNYIYDGVVGSPSEILINIANIDETLSRFPPPNVRAADISYTNVRITWDAVPGAAGYLVYRGSDVYAVTNAMYNDTGLSPAATYSYSVSTKDTNGESEKSNAVKASTLPIPVPSDLSAVSSGDTIQVSWNSVSVATAYNVYRSLNQNSYYSKISTVKTTSYTDYPDINISFLKYCYRVSSVMGSWESDQSDFVLAKTQ